MTSSEGTMKHIARSNGASPSRAQSTADTSAAYRALSRIKLELLDEYTGERKGYDPYDTSQGRMKDAWRVTRKRA
jgi:hypothetical protein